jgi:hypothetical protein
MDLQGTGPGLLTLIHHHFQYQSLVELTSI